MRGEGFSFPPLPFGLKPSGMRAINGLFLTKRIENAYVWDQRLRRSALFLEMQRQNGKKFRKPIIKQVNFSVKYDTIERIIENFSSLLEAA